MPVDQLFTDWVATDTITAAKLNQMKNDLAALASANFTATPTVNSNAVWHAGNDGASSGLDADLLDGLQLSAILTSTALTGTPTAPTASAGTDTTQVATTAFVQDELFRTAFVHAENVSTTAGNSVYTENNITFTTETTDTNSIITPSSDTFTIPTTGLYRFDVSVLDPTVTGATTSLVDIDLWVTILVGASTRYGSPTTLGGNAITNPFNGNLFGNDRNILPELNAYWVHLSLTASDTVKVQFWLKNTAGGGTATVSWEHVGVVLSRVA